MTWVEGRPYSASTRFSSFTTGGDRGRGSFSTSFRAWPMYITIWRRGENEKREEEEKIRAEDRKRGGGEEGKS